MLILAILLALPMGLLLGLLGGGGSILTLPILVYALGLGTKEAIATSLLVVAITTAMSTVQHARAGNVKYKVGITFGIFAMIGAYLGGLLAAYIPGQILILTFILLMIVAAIAMLRPRSVVHTQHENQHQPYTWLKIMTEGLVVGGITGMVGAGGGFVVVPALVLLAGLDMRSAIGTSLFIITLKSLAGLAGHLGHVSIDFTLAIAVTAPAILGSFAGSWLSHRVQPGNLRKWFAYFVLAMAAFMLYKSIPASIVAAVVVAYWPIWLAFLGVALALGIGLITRRRRHHDHIEQTAF